MILVDTNVWSEMLSENANTTVIAWIDANWVDLLLSSIALAEMRFGVEKLEDGSRRHRMAETADMIEQAKGPTMVGFFASEAHAYARLMARMRRAGTPLPLLDGMIAAQALANDVTVATRNTSDFARTGVALINPWNA